jgi:maltose alpha-D-glucosyltransferase/alpha-amylase
MQSRVREAFQNLQLNLSNIPAPLHREMDSLLQNRQEILDTLKRIYRKKLDVTKIRIHGNYSLDKVLLTGKDLAIKDFGGNPAQPFSERRLKRSPLRDVVGMICSIYYAAYEGFFNSYQVQKEDVHAMLPYAGLWAHYMSGFFMKAYLDTAQHTTFVPENPDDLAVLVQSLLLEQALQYLSSELVNRPDYTVVPLLLIQTIMQQASQRNEVSEANAVAH